MMYVLRAFSVTARKRDSLFVFGGNQQPERAAYTERLVDHYLHLREGPQEHQVFVNGVDLPPCLQPCHLRKVKSNAETSRNITELFYHK